MSKKSSKENKNDWALKLLAIVFAVMLWFYADAEQNPTIGKQFDVPVEYLNQAEDVIVVGKQPSIRITVRGKELNLSGLRGDDFKAYIDLSGARDGKHEYKVVVRAPNLSEKFSYSPDRVILEIEKVEKKEVPIRVKTTGSLAAGYEMEEIKVLPEKVMIAGRKEDLKNIKELTTEPIDIRDIEESTTKTAILQTIEDIHILGNEQVTVAFTVSTNQSNGTHEANINTVHVGEGLHVSLSRATASVEVSGPDALLNNRHELNKILLYVDCSGLGPGQYELPVKVTYRGELSLGGIQPHTIVVTIENNENPNPQPPEGGEDDGNHEGEVN